MLVYFICFERFFLNDFLFFPPRYADILAGKLQSKVTAVQKIETTRQLLKSKIEQFKTEKASIQPLVGKLTEQTKMLQSKVNYWIRSHVTLQVAFLTIILY